LSLAKNEPTTNWQGLPPGTPTRSLENVTTGQDGCGELGEFLLLELYPLGGPERLLLRQEHAGVLGPAKPGSGVRIMAGARRHVI